MLEVCTPLRFHEKIPQFTFLLQWQGVGEKKSDRIARVIPKHAVAVKNSEGKFVIPSLKTVMNGSYNPLSRPLFIYLNASKAEFDPNVKKFIDFYLKHAAVLSSEVGYIPFSKSEYTAITKHYKTLKTGTAFKMPAIGLSVQQMLDLSAENQ